MAVKEFQLKNHLSADGVVGTKTWDALCKKTGSTGLTLRKSRRIITEIIVHCSDTPEGRPQTVADITSWHKQRGYSTIGYNYVIYLDGSIHEGRSVDSVGAHCLGHNANSIGICYIGGRDKAMKKYIDTRTPAQKESMLKLLKELRVLYPKAKIYGHHDFDKGKPCPCFNAKDEYKNL